MTTSGSCYSRLCLQGFEEAHRAARQSKEKGETSATRCSIHPDQSFKKETSFFDSSLLAPLLSTCLNLYTTGQEAFLFP